MKINTNTRNLELIDIGSKNKYCATFNNKGNNEYKSKSKSKSKSNSKSKQNSKNKKNECITEPSKQNNKKKYFNNSNKKANIITNEFMNQIKSAQKETTKKLINKLNNINNINTPNKGTVFQPFSKINEKKLDSSTNKEKKENKNDLGIKKPVDSKQKKLKNNEKIKIIKYNCLTEDINEEKIKAIEEKTKKDEKPKDKKPKSIDKESKKDIEKKMKDNNNFKRLASEDIKYQPLFE